MLIKNSINNAAYSSAIAGVGTGSHSSWRRGSPHPKMGMSPCAAREQAAAPPMRPWVRRSSRTCPRPHCAPVPYSCRGHRSDQAGVPSCCACASGGRPPPTHNPNPNLMASAPSTCKIRSNALAFDFPYCSNSNREQRHTCHEIS